MVVDALRIDVESLRALRAVVQTGGFTPASEALGLSQSAVSHKIKRLEDRVGLNLVERGAVIEATADGADLLRYAERILTAHDEAVAHMSRSDLEGVLRLGSNEDLHSDELVAVLARFSRAYPNVRIDVRVQVSGVIAEWYDAGDVDVALLQIPADGPEGPRPGDQVVRREQVRWVCAPGSNFRTDAVVPLLSFGDGWAYRGAIESLLHESKIHYRIALECPTVGGVQSAVEAGLGVAALNERNMTSRMIDWAPGSQIGVPAVCSVLRSADASGEDDADPALTALRRELASQFNVSDENEGPDV